MIHQYPDVQRVHIHLEIFQCSVHYKSYLRFSKPNSFFLYIILELKELQVLKWDGVVGRVLELVLKLESQTFGQTHLLSQVRFSIYKTDILDYYVRNSLYESLFTKWISS